MSMVAQWLRQLTIRIFLVVLAYATYATVTYTLAVLPIDSRIRLVVSVVVSGALLGAVWLWRERLAGLAQALAAAAGAVRPRHWVAACLALGLLLRWALLTACIPAQTSDFLAYTTLARNLAENGIYAMDDARAYWPPGLPFLMLPGVALLGAHWLVPVINNCILLALSLWVAYNLAQVICGARGARLVVLLLALWPNTLLATGLADKQLLLIVLVSGSLLCYLRMGAADARPRYLYGFGCGALLGAAVLTQPSHLLFPLVYAAFELLRGSRPAIAALRLALVAGGMVLVVSPWTYRNYVVLDAFVPVANTGGISLYVGNNPAATGRHVPVNGLAGLDELAANREGARRARAWIAENPGAFVRLIVPKNLEFLGNDADGAFWALKRGCGYEGGAYVLGKGLCQLAWLGLLLLTFAAIATSRRELAMTAEPAALLPMLWLLYFLCLHSVFESGGRHHIAPSVGIMMLAMYGLRAAPRAVPARGA